jgi:Ca-activated chloride channel homolog
LVKEVTQTFFAVADNVFLNVHFDTSVIKQYRLIGFDNKKVAIADTTGELEGGEIGSGNSIMAAFEVEPVVPDTAGHTIIARPVAQVSLNYSLNNNDKVQQEIAYDCIDNYKEFEKIDKDYQLAAAIAMFGMKLRQSKYLGDTRWEDIEAIAQKTYNPNDYLQSEFVRLVAIAKKMYPKKKKRKKKDPDFN